MIKYGNPLKRLEPSTHYETADIVSWELRMSTQPRQQLSKAIQELIIVLSVHPCHDSGRNQCHKIWIKKRFSTGAKLYMNSFIKKGHQSGLIYPHRCLLHWESCSKMLWNSFVVIICFITWKLVRNFLIVPYNNIITVSTQFIKIY